MHVVMAVHTVRLSLVQTPEFFDLGRYDILEVADEPGVKDCPGSGMPQQVAGKFTLTFKQPCRTIRRRKPRGEVQVQAGVDSSLPGHRCGPLRILHEDHGTHGRYSSPLEAIEDLPGRAGVSPPVVGVHDKKTGIRIHGSHGHGMCLIAVRASHRRVYSKYEEALDPFSPYESFADHGGEQGEFEEAR